MLDSSVKSENKFSLLRRFHTSEVLRKYEPSWRNGRLLVSQNTPSCLKQIQAQEASRRPPASSEPSAGHAHLRWFLIILIKY